MERAIIVMLLVFVSCSSTKKLKRDNTKTKTEAIDCGELTIKRASDTLELTIPKIVYKVPSLPHQTAFGSGVSFCRETILQRIL